VVVYEVQLEQIVQDLPETVQVLSIRPYDNNVLLKAFRLNYR
jgi:hypothetical protein